MFFNRSFVFSLLSSASVYGQQPDIFRIASEIRLSPNAQDYTKIDCVATIEQWFAPKTL
jgi:hypothetical protein